MQASWLKTAEAIDFVRAVGPRRTVPIHEGQVNERGLSALNHNLAAHTDTATGIWRPASRWLAEAEPARPANGSGVGSAAPTAARRPRSAATGHSSAITARGRRPRVTPRRVAEQVAARRRGGRQRVPLGDRAEPARHRAARRTCWRRTRTARPGSAPRPRPRACRSPGRGRCPIQRNANRSSSSSPTAARSAETCPCASASPTSSPPRQHGQPDTEFSMSATLRPTHHGRGCHRHRAEPVGDAPRGVGGDRDHGGLQPEEHRHREHPRHQELEVVPAAGHRHRAAEQVAEHQHHRAPGTAGRASSVPGLATQWSGRAGSRSSRRRRPNASRDHAVGRTVMRSLTSRRSGGGTPRRAWGGAG